jgi:hypothetical protein
MKDNGILRTSVLPRYNCNNCAHFQKKKEIFDAKTGAYAVECRNVAHPLEDCVMRGFEAHSEQPGLTDSLNMNELINAKIEVLREHLEHPTKPGYRRSDIANRLRELERQVKR